MVYLFDLDNTLCITPKIDQYYCYEKAVPIPDRIAKVNSLYDDGHTIIIDTARGCNSGKDWHQFTYTQLTEWGVKFHNLRSGIKFAADFYVDDKAINSNAFF